MLDAHHLYGPADYLDLRPDGLGRYIPHHPHHHLPPHPHHHPHPHHPHHHPHHPHHHPRPASTPLEDSDSHRQVNMFGMSMVERYLYSLPEYRTEMHKSNFIEIYSYNGLLATRKVIEFDGDTVLCRVCGDKASGFHYGVHACEGCKGFFRRSIQQKIQYRPCLKNQQCNIMRVNRNRCQYCRLKKCIAVGMSRDAVRFGRVPKKEKAKIMEQMHKVNSQSQVTLLNTILESGSDITQKVVESHLRTCEFTRSKLRAFLDKAWQTPQFVTCPAHMACPLNPSPETSDGTKKWDEFSECFTPAIRNVVNFAKCIPGFQLLSQEDQVTLLKAGTFEVLLVHLACLFDASTNTMCFANGKLYKRVSLTVTNSAGFLLDSMFDFAERLNTMQLSDEEVALFSAIVIIAADRPGLRNVEQVERVQNRITQALQALMSSKHPDDPALFAKLLMKIPDLRTLNTLHSEKLLGLTVPAGSGKNGSAGEKTRTAMDAHPTYFPSGMLPGGFPMFSGPVMPGHMRGEASMQFPGHPPDVSTIMPHQVALDSASPAHNVVLQTPLGTFHRYNNALQQHMSLNRQHSEYPPQHPAARNAGQCPRGRDAGEKEECVDIKPRDFQHVPKFKIEEGVGSNNHVGVPSLSEHRSSREDSRSDAQHGDSRSDSPNVNRDSVSVATSDSGSPKLDVFPPPPPHGSANWASTSSRQSVERPQEPVSHSGSGSVSARSTEHNSNKKRLLSEEDEIMTAKMQKFWNESAGGGCPVGAGYSRSMAGSMQPSLPMSVLQSPSLMSAYRKDAMLQYHHQQQQQYQHHKQFPPPNHHHPLAPRFHSDQLPSTQVDNQRHYPPPTGGLSRQGPGSPEVLPDPSRSPAVSPGCARGENTGVNLPELKNALTRPPLASPGWSGEHGRSESESDTMQEPETRYSGDKHNDLKRSTSPSDPYYLHHEMKAKRRCSNDTVTSEGSGARDQDLHQRDTSGLSYSHLDGPDRGLTESHPPPRRHLSGEHERHSDTLQDERYRSHNEELQRTEPGLESASDLDALRDDGTVRDHHIPSRSQTDPPVLLRSPQFYSESESRDCGNSPPMLVLETEPRLDQVGQSVISRPRSPHIPSTKPMHPDEHRPGVVIENKDSKMRHTNMPYENNNNNKYYLPEVSKPNDNQGQDHHKPLNKSGLGALHGVPNGVHSGGAYMGPGGMAPPHPAYLPLPFPSVHPAIMYQYNQFAAAQMAQLQQMQLAQAQMALHQQVVLSKSEGPYPGVPHKDSPTQGVLPVQRGPTERHRDDATKSEPLREGRPLNLSKPQDMMPTGQQPVFVKPEPL